jgi:hypothetical protein
MFRCRGESGVRGRVTSPASRISGHNPTWLVISMVFQFLDSPNTDAERYDVIGSHLASREAEVRSEILKEPYVGIESSSG